MGVTRGGNNISPRQCLAPGCSTGLVHVVDECEYHKTALVGDLISPVAWLATLPLSLQFITFNNDDTSCITLNSVIWPKADFYCGCRD